MNMADIATSDFDCPGAHQPVNLIEQYNLKAAAALDAEYEHYKTLTFVEGTDTEKVAFTAGWLASARYHRKNLVPST